MGFAASKLGIPSPPPYLSVAQNVDALVKGVNYASGGAGILNDTGLYFVIIPSFSRIFTLKVTLFLWLIFLAFTYSFICYIF